MAKGTLHLNVEFSAVADEEGKFGRLAKLLGLADADHARGRCEHLWVACTRRGESDLPQWLVEQVLGDLGPEALIESGLAGWAGGRGDSKTRRISISGAAKHCLWMAADQAAKRGQSSKGGKTRAANASRAGGRFTSDPPADSPAQTSPSEISSEISSDPEDTDPPPARAIPPSPAPPAPAAPPPAEHPGERPDLAARSAARALIRAQLEASRSRAGATRKVAVQPLLAFDRGLDVDLTEQLTRAPTLAALDVLVGQARHAIAMAELEVTHGGKSFEWFTGSIFTGGNFPRLVGMTAADAKRPPKSALDRYGKPEPTPMPQPKKFAPVEDVAPDERAAVAAMAAEAHAALFGRDSARAPPRSAPAIDEPDEITETTEDEYP